MEKPTITFYTSTGSNSSNAIGSFVIKNIDYFKPKFNIKINKFNTNESSSFNTANPRSPLPIAIYNKEIFSGLDNILDFLSNLIISKSNETSYEDYISSGEFNNYEIKNHKLIDLKEEDPNTFDTEMEKKKRLYIKKIGNRQKGESESLSSSPPPPTTKEKRDLDENSPDYQENMMNYLAGL